MGTSRRSNSGRLKKRSAARVKVPREAARPEFADEAARSLERLRLAVGRLVGQVPGGARRAADLRRVLDLDTALAWQIHSLAAEDDALSAGRLVPKAGAMDRFFKAARGLRLAGALAKEAEEAYGDFERVVSDHAGDRETFDAMLSALRPDDGATLQRLRRAAFKASAAVWGLTSRCTIHAVIFRQRPTGEHDCLSLRARIGLQRLHENAVIAIYASSRTWGGGSCPPDGAQRVSVDTCELLPDYCSRPMPRIDRVDAPDGSVREFLKPEGLGRTGEVSVYWRSMAADFPGGTTAPPHGATTPCLEPTELLVTDLLVPRGWTDPGSSRVWVTPESSRYATSRLGTEPHRLPFEGTVEHLGSRVERMYTAEAPRYPELVTEELSRLGWSRTEFDIYRCVVKYPVLYSAVHVCLER